MPGDGLIRKKYDSINCIEDLIPLISDLDDGEAPWLEFKAINNQECKKSITPKIAFSKRNLCFFKYIRGNCCMGS